MNSVISAGAVIDNYANKFSAFKDKRIEQGLFVNPLWGKTDSELAELISTLTDREKASELLIWSLPGTSLSAKESQSLRSEAPGGVILMGDNITSQNQLKKLTADIQQTNSKIPLFIATDQEGGVVKRVKWDDTAGEKSWANLTDEQVCAIGTQRSQTLLAGGINLNLAPVVDLTYSAGGFINNRTISGDPALVSQKALQFVTCSEEQGILTTLKHFPGHGATGQDSHNTLPVITKSNFSW